MQEPDLRISILVKKEFILKFLINCNKKQNSSCLQTAKYFLKNKIQITAFEPHAIIADWLENHTRSRCQNRKRA